MNPNAQDFCPRATTAPRTTPTVPIDGVSRSTWRQRRQSERDSERNGEAAGEVCRFFRMGRCKHGANCKYVHATSRARTSRPRRGQAGEAFRRAESIMGTPQLVTNREDLVAALRAAGGDAFRVKVHVTGCDCHRAAAFGEVAPGLLAIPDSRGTRTALHVAGAGGREALEATLAASLFPDPPIDDVVLKANCARCVLDLEPNGTVAVVGDRRDLATHVAAYRAAVADSTSLHGDAAHAVAVAPISLLRAAFQAPSRQSAAAARQLGLQLEPYGLPAKAAPPKADHHLLTFLNCPQVADTDVFVIAYDARPRRVVSFFARRALIRRFPAAGRVALDPRAPGREAEPRRDGLGRGAARDVRGGAALARRRGARGLLRPLDDAVLRGGRDRAVAAAARRARPHRVGARGRGPRRRPAAAAGAAAAAAEAAARGAAAAEAARLTRRRRRPVESAARLA